MQDGGPQHAEHPDPGAAACSNVLFVENTNPALSAPVEEPAWKQRAIERDSGFLDHHLVTLRAIDEADDVDQRLVQRPDLMANMCILHFFP